jgi:K+-sensing histidine kinase KdpD
MTMLQELAHDLRTPVASLKQFQEILLYKGHLMDDEKSEKKLKPWP